MTLTAAARIPDSTTASVTTSFALTPMKRAVRKSIDAARMCRPIVVFPSRSVRAPSATIAQTIATTVIFLTVSNCPCPIGSNYSYPCVTVITCKRVGVPLHRANLAGGPSQLIVIPDESQVETGAEDWSRFGRQVQFAHLQLPTANFTYHYRLVATIALAEISRQVGRRPAVKVPTVPRPPIYDHAVKELAEAAGEIVSFDELLRY